MPIAINYPHSAGAAPAHLSRKIIQELAATLRQRIAGMAARPLALDHLAARTAELRINGCAMRLAWDWRHSVHDAEGAPALGACEYDPAEPGMIMISINGELLAHCAALQRSTAAHELAHAIFDMPASMLAARRKAFRLQPAPARPLDWAEWRADEFMGEFLAPRRALEKALARAAAEHGLLLRWRVEDGVPRPMIGGSDSHALDSIIGGLAEQFGLSAAFIARRCARHRLIALGDA